MTTHPMPHLKTLPKPGAGRRCALTQLIPLFLLLSMTACQQQPGADSRTTPSPKETSDTTLQEQVKGTWQLISGTIVENSDTTVTYYTGDTSFIKIINGSHFAFLEHDLHRGADDRAIFASGGGAYSLDGSKYTEHLEYCTDRAWEGHSFSFDVHVRQDTLIQQGIEQVPGAGINRVNTEKYVRVPEVDQH